MINFRKIDLFSGHEIINSIVYVGPVDYRQIQLNRDAYISGLAENKESAKYFGHVKRLGIAYDGSVGLHVVLTTGEEITTDFDCAYFVNPH